jgi:hypothetical protein
MCPFLLHQIAIRDFFFGSVESDHEYSTFWVLYVNEDPRILYTIFKNRSYNPSEFSVLRTHCFKHQPGFYKIKIFKIFIAFKTARCFMLAVVAFDLVSYDFFHISVVYPFKIRKLY